MIEKNKLEDQNMEKKKLLDLETLQEVTGGVSSSEEIDFRMNVYRAKLISTMSLVLDV